MASDYTAFHLAIYTTNCEMDLLHSSGKAYAAQLTASGVKVERSVGSLLGYWRYATCPQAGILVIACAASTRWERQAVSTDHSAVVFGTSPDNLYYHFR
jgi:hypothetical protein